MANSTKPPFPAASGIFGAFFHALHESRQRQAAQVLRQHAHLLDGQAHGAACKSPAAEDESAQQHGPSPRTAALVARTLMAGALVLFLLLHVIAATMLERARPADGGLAARASVLNYD